MNLWFIRCAFLLTFSSWVSARKSHGQGLSQVDALLWRGQSGLQQKEGPVQRRIWKGAREAWSGSVTLPWQRYLLGSVWLEGLEYLRFFKLRCSSHAEKEQILNVQFSGIYYIHNSGSVPEPCHAPLRRSAPCPALPSHSHSSAVCLHVDLPSWESSDKQESHRPALCVWLISLRTFPRSVLSPRPWTDPP